MILIAGLGSGRACSALSSLSGATPRGAAGRPTAVPRSVFGNVLPVRATRPRCRTSPSPIWRQRSSGSGGWGKRDSSQVSVGDLLGLRREPVRPRTRVALPAHRDAGAAMSPASTCGPDRQLRGPGFATQEPDLGMSLATNHCMIVAAPAQARGGGPAAAGHASGPRASLSGLRPQSRPRSRNDRTAVAPATRGGIGRRLASGAGRRRRGRSDGPRTVRRAVPPS